MRVVAIMGNGPVDHIPDLKPYEKEIDIWIGADRGAWTLVENEIPVHYAVGDFDSIAEHQRDVLAHKVTHFDLYAAEKDETDLELALQKAFEIKADKIYLFGVTGGRLDHALINIQLLHTVADQAISGIIVDKWNQLELTKPGTHIVNNNEQYPYISFVPFTKHVRGLSLTGFYYSLEGADIIWGSTRCISNELVSSDGTVSYQEGVLLFIKSRDATPKGLFL